MPLFFKSGLVLSIGITWRDSVLDVGTLVLPGSPSYGDRYVLAAGHATNPNEIAEWNGAIWVYTVPAEGWTLYSEADDGLFVYDGTAWDYIGPNPDHNLLTGLQGGALTEYYHLTAAEHTELTSIAALGTAADKMLYTTGADTWAEADITAAGRALLDDATAAAQATTLGLGTLDSPLWAGASITNDIAIGGTITATRLLIGS